MADPVKNITYVVTSALNRLGLAMEDYDRLEQIAIEWYTEKGRSSAGVPSVEVDHFYVGNGSRIYPMPSDMITPSRIGIKVGEYFWTLTRVDQLFVGDAPYQCEDFTTAPDNDFGLTWTDHYWNGQYYPAAFSAGGGFNFAYYTVNHSKRQIEFSMDVKSLPNGEAWIEYVSSGKGVNGNTVVNPAYIEPFRYYLMWQICYMHENQLFNRRSEDLERLYHETMYNANGSLAPTAQEVLDALYQVSGYSIR